MTTIEELEKRIQKQEKISKLFEYLLSTIETLTATIISEGENIVKLQSTRETLRKIRDKYNEITLK